LEYRPDLSLIFYEDNTLPIPLDEWFLIEGYYKISKDEDGQVIVWQNKTEIFNVSGFPTTLSDFPIYWSVNNYTNKISPNPCTIYVDDILISTSRIEQP